MPTVKRSRNTWHFAGQYNIWDIFQSHAAGNVVLTATFNPHKLVQTQQPASVLLNEEERAAMSKLAEIAQSGDNAGQPPGVTENCFCHLAVQVSNCTGLG